jgi:AraC-like DNA-binding protein
MGRHLAAPGAEVGDRQPDRAVAERSADREAVADTVSSHLSRLVLDVAHRQGVAEADIAHLPGFASDALSDDLVRPPTASLLRLWELMTAAVPEPGLGLQVAERADLGRLHIWDYLFTSGTTLTEGARQAARYLRLVVDPSATMTVVDNGAQLTIGYSSEAPWTQAAAPIHEFILALILRRCREAIDRPIVPLHVGFAHDAPLTRRHLTQAFGTGHLDFAAPVNSITFLAADIPAARPVDSELARILNRYADMAASRSRPVPSWRDRFDGALATALADATPSLAEVAVRLAISPRTLQRRLSEGGTTWQQELDSARRERALQLLSDPRLSMRTVSARLGYTDTRSLRRAISRWKADSDR